MHKRTCAIVKRAKSHTEVLRQLDTLTDTIEEAIQLDRIPILKLKVAKERSTFSPILQRVVKPRAETTTVSYKFGTRMFRRLPRRLLSSLTLCRGHVSCDIIRLRSTQQRCYSNKAGHILSRCALIQISSCSRRRSATFDEPLRHTKVMSSNTEYASIMLTG